MNEHIPGFQQSTSNTVPKPFVPFWKKVRAFLFGIVIGIIAQTIISLFYAIFFHLGPVWRHSFIAALTETTFIPGAILNGITVLFLFFLYKRKNIFRASGILCTLLLSLFISAFWLLGLPYLFYDAHVMR